MNYRQPFEGEYPITQKYGEVIEGVTKDNKPHTGIDYGCPIATPILASEAGTVMFASFDHTGYGLTVIIQHTGGKATLYAHLSLITPGLTVGGKVERSQVIGYSGTTGNSTGPHLHFEARTQALNYKTHFNPLDLPLTTFADADSNIVTDPQNLKDAAAFKEGEILKIAAPLGAKGFYSDQFDYYTPYQQNSRFYYTGVTTKYYGYTYMQVIPLNSKPVWIAVHDGDAQILDKAG